MGSKTIKLKPYSRRVITAVSDGAQGADAIQQLADTAYANLLNAKWEIDTNEPTLPVHEYDRPRPYGQAYKAVWGYDAVSRSEKSCCGAVCYKYKLPNSAIGFATITSIKVRLAVDRYCDKGATIHFCPSGQNFYLEAKDALQLGDFQNIYATETQVGEDGLPLPPNKRQPVVGDYILDTYSIAPYPTQSYCDIYLRLSDYTSVRGAWIEGGAMFANEEIEVTFDMEVEPDSGLTGNSCPMNIGVFNHSDDAINENIRTALISNTLPYVSMYSTYSYNIVTESSSMSISSSDIHTLLHIPTKYIESTSTEVAIGMGRHSTVRTAGSYATLGVGSSTINSKTTYRNSVAVLMAHGFTNDRVFTKLHFEKPLPFNVRVCVYAMKELITVQDSESMYKTSTPIVWWGSLMTDEFYRGDSTTLRAITTLKNLLDTYGGSDFMGSDNLSEEKTQQFKVENIFARDCESGASCIEFESDFKSSLITSLVIAVIPNKSTYDTDVEFSLGDITLE